MMMALYILIHEIKHNHDFNKWCKKRELIISLFTVLSCADVEILNILSSEIAGLSIFFAPQLSEKFIILIFLASCINVFLEDIPQFVIQVSYPYFFNKFFFIVSIFFFNN